MNSIPDPIIITFNIFFVLWCSARIVRVYQWSNWDWTVIDDHDRPAITLLQFTTLVVPICLYLFTFYCKQNTWNKHVLTLLFLNSFIWINLIHYVRNSFISLGFTNRCWLYYIEYNTLWYYSMYYSSHY